MARLLPLRERDPPASDDWPEEAEPLWLLMAVLPLDTSDCEDAVCELLLPATGPRFLRLLEEATEEGDAAVPDPERVRLRGKLAVDAVALTRRGVERLHQILKRYTRYHAATPGSASCAMTEHSLASARP